MKFNKYLNRGLLLFFVLILAVPVYWVARGKVEPQGSILENRTLTVFPSLNLQDFKTATGELIRFQFESAGNTFFNQFADRSFQKKFEQAASDQFPFRSEGIRFSRRCDSLMAQLTLQQSKSRP